MFKVVVLLLILLLIFFLARRWFIHRRNATVLCHGAPGTLLPKGFCVGFSDHRDVVLVSVKQVKIGPSGVVKVQARQERRWPSLPSNWEP